MAQPVWVLSVDLQTKTATFQTGMAEAARSARGAFGDIRSGAGEMAVGVSKGSIDVRHSLGLVDNVIRGAHAQAMADLVRMYAQSAIVMNTLPIAATAAGLALIGGIAYEAAERIKKMKEEAQKLRNALINQDTAGAGVFRQLDDEFLKAEQRSDELRNDHLGALKTELELINNQSLEQLAKSFETVEKSADDALKNISTSWYAFWDSGATGASNALENFQVKYKNLLNHGKGKDASDLLHGTLANAQQILALQNTINSNRTGTGLLGPNLKDPEAYYTALYQLQAKGVGHTEAEVKAQQALVTALEQQVGIESQLNTIKDRDKKNSKLGAANEAAARASAAAKESAAAQLSMGQAAIAGEKATADAQLTIHRASIEERLASDLDFAKRERDTQEAANNADIAGLNKSGNDYATQLQALNDKALVIQQQYSTKIATLKAAATIAENQRDTQALEQGIRQQIDATQEGSVARLAAIDAGIREEQARNLQQTSFYKSLLTERVNVSRQAAEEQAKQKADAAREDADNAAKMGELSVAAEKQQIALADSVRRVSDQQRAAEAQRIANEEYAIELQGLEQKIQGLDKSGNDYLTKLKQLQDKEKQLTQQHENEMAAIKDKAVEESNQNILSAYERLVNETSRDLTQSIMGHQTWAHTLESLGNQVVSGMMQNAIKSALMDDFDRERDAAKAARKFFLAGAQLPFPANIVAAPALAAGAFATVMAFEKGGIVPGVGHGDIVPAMLTPGEAILPKSMTEMLTSAARSISVTGGNHTTHVHVRPTYNIQALDGDGLSTVLKKHSDQLTQHFHASVRRMNRS